MEKFKPGDIVRFKGVTEPALKVTALPVTGELFLCDSNTPMKGVMAIKGDKQRMQFLPNGTIYCHPRFGCVLDRIVEETGPELIDAEIVKELNTPVEFKEES